VLLTFFDSKGLIYTHIVPRGSTVNAAYIVKVLDVFMRHFKKKRPVMAEQPWFFHWDNAPVHTAAIVQDWLQVQVLCHLPYSPDLAPADFFLFRRVKEELAGAPSRRSGKGSREVSPPTSSPPPSGGGSSAAISALTSAAYTSRNHKK
jgi:hypothetical protein